MLAFLRETASVSEIAGTPSRIAAIIQHAIEGGEIDRPRIASLPVDLVRHDVIMNQVPALDDTLIEIVDPVPQIAPETGLVDRKILGKRHQRRRPKIQCRLHGLLGQHVDIRHCALRKSGGEVASG